MSSSWCFADDVDAMVAALDTDWPRLKGARLFMTGGTGFLGRWMLEALREADLRHGLGVETVILSRDPAAFARRAPHLAQHPGFSFVTGDTRDFHAPAGPFSHIVHAATDASAALNADHPLLMFDTIVAGSRRALEFAVAQGSARLLLLSSGAVYGAQPSDVMHVAEDWPGSPDCRDPRSAYGEGKRAAEMLAAIFARQTGLDIVTARIFATLGPLLPLDIHFAAGNFIRDALLGRTIVVEGAGTAVRSYLYAADVAIWLWALLLRAAPGTTYNVGSEDAVSIAQLAQRTAALLGAPGVDILGRGDPGWNPGRYVPSTAAIRRDLGLCPLVSLDEAVRRTAIWNGWTP